MTTTTDTIALALAAAIAAGVTPSAVLHAARFGSVRADSPAYFFADFCDGSAFSYTPTHGANTQPPPITVPASFDGSYADYVDYLMREFA